MAYSGWGSAHSKFFIANLVLTEPDQGCLLAYLKAVV